MKLSTRSRYGTRLMAILALRYGHGPVLLREISEREAISEKYLSQIVIPLRSASLIRSVRGARGGYVLAREPAQIDLRQIVEALEGGLDIADSDASAAKSASLAGLVVRGVWEELGAQIARSLSEITLEEIVHRVRQGGESPAMYNI
jgi:Rrf2 family protein